MLAPETRDRLPAGTQARHGRRAWQKARQAQLLASQLGGAGPASSSLSPQIRTVVEAAGQGILRTLVESLEKAYATDPEAAVSRLLERNIPNWATQAGRAVMEAVMC